MNQLLQVNQKLKSKNGTEYRVDKYLGGGGQGEVYQVSLGADKLALKWYFKQAATAEQKKAIDSLVKKGAPDARFLWPLELVESSEIKGFGYVMALRSPAYRSIVDLMKRKAEPSFKALAIASVKLADSFLQIHSKGLCYRDISFGNVFIHPDTGDILVCDNDNVAVDCGASSGVVGTPRFMAPEVVRVESRPNMSTDLFSLAVLLFYMHMLHHPLEGKKEAEIKCMDLPAMNKLYGTNPIFIFDPNNDQNRPVKGLHDNALALWPIYPEFIQKLFIKAFTVGLNDPQHSRVRESEWRQAMLRLKDSITTCPKCGSELFYDSDVFQAQGKLNPCWNCKTVIDIAPLRIKIGDKLVLLNTDTKLYDIHLNPQSSDYNFTNPVAEMAQNPKDLTKWGIRNLSAEKWVARQVDGTMLDIDPGRTISPSKGLKINFGLIEGEIVI